MNNLLKMEKYQLSHNIFYWWFNRDILIGFFTADTYVPEAMGAYGWGCYILADILMEWFTIQPFS